MKSTQPVEVIVTIPVGVDIEQVWWALISLEKGCIESGISEEDQWLGNRCGEAVGIIGQIKERIVT